PDSLPPSSRPLDDLNRSLPVRRPSQGTCAMRTHGRLVGYVSTALGAFDESHASSYFLRGLPLVLRAAEHDVLHDLSGLEGNGSLWGSEHAAQLRDLAWQQAVHARSGAAFRRARARGGCALGCPPS